VHDDAPLYLSHAVRDVLTNAYYNRWIGRGGPTAWPPRSPGLNPLNICLMGHQKFFVYTTPVANEEALHHRIVDVSQTPQLPRHF
jgi:hypothetical protein